MTCDSSRLSEAKSVDNGAKEWRENCAVKASDEDSDKHARGDGVLLHQVACSVAWTKHGANSKSNAKAKHTCENDSRFQRVAHASEYGAQIALGNVGVF
jgi:hypothetical protein